VVVQQKKRCTEDSKQRRSGSRARERRKANQRGWSFLFSKPCQASLPQTVASQVNLKVMLLTLSSNTNEQQKVVQLLPPFAEHTKHFVDQAKCSNGKSNGHQTNTSLLHLRVQPFAVVGPLWPMSPACFSIHQEMPLLFSPIFVDTHRSVFCGGPGYSHLCCLLVILDVVIHTIFLRFLTGHFPHTHPRRTWSIL